VTEGALRLEDLGVEDRLRLWVGLMACQAGCRKRRVDGFRVGGGPVGDDVATGAVAEACGRLMRCIRWTLIAMASTAGARNRRVWEVGLCPIRIIRVTACALGLDGLGVEEGLR